ncbi:hypothetical protein [Spongiactinospora sp. TRM90649]|uniref:hypothetical protein n=1 Tax=Spongiactinospora sp. TRM90649 TaxID=3031114 RepID=UPI0023F68A44|nr:hypothetical protein [Spongiactinospora sp. TRM90649]MDF5753598.1 hypothetical protein [Spongiactinospora sp. TRM90649]
MDPRESPWHLLGAAIRHWRVIGSGTQQTTAKAALVDAGDLSKWERAVMRPTRPAVCSLDQHFGAGNQLIALYDIISELERLHKIAENSTHEFKEDATDRRRLLQFAAAAGVTVTAGDPTRLLFELALGGEPRTAEQWHRSTMDHLHALRTRAPRVVADEILIDLMLLREQIGRPGGDDTIELQRALAVLAAFYSSMKVRLGDHGTALRFYRTANRAADASGDLDLRLRIRAHEAYHSLFGPRDPAVVLEMARDGQRLTDGRPSVGLASLVCEEVKALADLGRNAEAASRLQDLEDLAEADLPAIPGFWESAADRVSWAALWVHAKAGDETSLSGDIDLLRIGSGNYQYSTSTTLHRALCTVAAGGVKNGTRQATTAIAALRPEFRNEMITWTAHRVLQAVPRDQRDRGEVRELAHILSARTSA